MKFIPLTKGFEAIVDDEDFEKVSRYKWHLCNGYAARAVYGGPKKVYVYMHREIANPSCGMEIDHKNLNKLDNRRENLRECSSVLNKANAAVRKHNVLGVKGVQFHTQSGKYRARIRVQGKNISLGLFHSIQDAALAYKVAAENYYGEFSRT